MKLCITFYVNFFTVFEETLVKLNEKRVLKYQKPECAFKIPFLMSICAPKGIALYRIPL